MSIDRKTGYELVMIAVICMKVRRCDPNIVPAYIKMNSEFYSRMINDLKPSESVDGMFICNIPFIGRRD